MRSTHIDVRARPRANASLRAERGRRSSFRNRSRGANALEATDAWYANDFERFCEHLRRENPRISAAGNALECARAHVVDMNVIAVCAWTATARRRRMEASEIRQCAKISERWRWRLGGSLASIEASLKAEDVRETPAARAVRARVEEAREDVERVTRKYLHDAVVEEERFSVGAIARDGKDASERESGEIPEQWRWACANVNAYLDATGVELTFVEWSWVRVIFDGLVSAVDGEDVCSRIVRDDAVWHEMKALIDDSTIRPRKSSQKANSARYLLAQVELSAAKKEWMEAERTYKNARQRVKQARHNVHKTRKAVRIEYR